ncbi:MAG TPA: tetratricopeptide repeat protein, partial [Puia sp.]|nr:tetratricopeptide repeat protein [Puia sp.]
MSNPLATYKPTKRVAEVYVKKASNNKWLVYISRIGYYNPVDTSRDISNNVVITYPKNQTSSSDVTEGSMKPQSEAAAASLFNLYIDQAVQAEKKRDYQSAINFYYKAIDIQPIKRGVYESHIKELTTVYRKISDLDERYRAGYYKDVIREYSDLLKKPKVNPDYANSDYYFGRGKCFDKLGQQTRSYNEQIKNYSDALADYAKSYEYDNTNMETVRNRADLYRRMDRNIEALTEYKTLVANDPSNLDAYEAMSDLHMQNGELDLATKDIDAALSQENVGQFAKSRLYVDKGALYVRKKDYATAEDYFTRAISLDSNSGLAFYYRGMSRIRLNKVQSAARDLVSARQKGLDSADFSFPKDMENYRKFVAYRPNEVPSS